MCHVYLERKTFSGGIWDCLAVEGMVSWRQIFREVQDMEDQFLNLTEENLDREHLCCIIRSKKPHPGVEAKRAWLRERLQEGHVFRKLDTKGVVFIEYAPLETAWVPVEGDNYLYINCLWVSGEFKGKGYGKQLMEYCLADARAKGKSGVCMLGAEKQKASQTRPSQRSRDLKRWI